jgi:monofunctional chorismate mutase
MDLKELRDKINQIDQELARLFQERMEVVSLVAKYKKENNLKIFDAQREEEVIKQNSCLVSDELKDYYTKLLKELMELSKQYQKEIIDK